MAADRRARPVWEGTLLEGQGRLSTGSTPVLSDQSVTWASRTEGPGGEPARAAFEEMARAGEEGCPISKAIRGNVGIRLTAELEG